MNTKNVEVYSETKHYKVVKKNSTQVQLIDSSGENIIVGKEYLRLLDSADDFSSEEKVTQTELSNIIKDNPNKAMSITFTTKDSKKSKRSYEAEKAERKSEILTASISNAEKLLNNLMDNPVLDYTPGKERKIKGYTTGVIAANGNYTFVDAEDDYIPKDCINPQKVQEIIVNNTKYIRK